MIYGYEAFVNHDGGGLSTVHLDVEGCAANGDYRSRRKYARRVWAPSELLDMDFDASQKDVDEVPHTTGIASKNNLRIGVDGERASVGQR